MPFDDRETIRLYVLGRLPEQDRLPVATRVLEDKATSDLARQVENDLIGELARGELTAGDARRVQWLLDQSVQPGRLSFAAVAHAPERTFRGPLVVATFVAIAIVFLIAIISAFYLLTPARKKAVAQMMAASTPAPAAVFSLNVPGGAPPANAGPAMKVKLPAGTEQVRVSINLEPGFDSYAVELRTESGEVVQHRDGRPGAFDFTLPASALPPGRYDIVVNGRRKGGSDGPVNNRYFVLE